MTSTPTACNCSMPLILTMAEWKAKHKDFKGTHKGPDGKRWRSALRYCPVHGTTLMPVTIRKEET